MPILGFLRPALLLPRFRGPIVTARARSSMYEPMGYIDALRNRTGNATSQRGVDRFAQDHKRKSLVACRAQNGGFASVRRLISRPTSAAQAELRRTGSCQKGTSEHGTFCPPLVLPLHLLVASIPTGGAFVMKGHTVVRAVQRDVQLDCAQTSRAGWRPTSDGVRAGSAYLAHKQRRRMVFLADILCS